MEIKSFNDKQMEKMSEISHKIDKKILKIENKIEEYKNKFVELLNIVKKIKKDQTSLKNIRQTYYVLTSNIYTFVNKLSDYKQDITIFIKKKYSRSIISIVVKVVS